MFFHDLFAGDPPEWFDLGQYFEIVTGLSQSVKNVITGGGREWIEDIIDTNDDLVYQMTKGKFTTVCND